VTLADDASIDAVTGEFHGHPTLRLEHGTAWVEVLAASGPRIVGLGRTGEPNLLAETPDLGWETPYGRYELVGGHRLWFAPEDPERVAMPDGDGLAVERLGDGVRLVGAIEPVTGLVRTIEVRLEPGLPAVRVRHALHNSGAEPLHIAPWSITQLPLGGRVLLPQPPAAPGHDVRPNRNLVLWPYTSWEDGRIRIRDGLVAVDAVGGEELKVGCLDEAGWVAYVRDGLALVRRFEPAVGEAHPDLGCNVETYCGPGYLELEVLGPLRVLEPDGTVELDERWELRPIIVPVGDELQMAAQLASPLLGMASPDGHARPIP
jgi:hypothetical protein